MGRPAKSAEEKKARGTLQKCRENRTQFVVNGELPLAPPVGLKKEPRAIWEVTIKCAPKGHLTPLEHALVERFCRLYGLWRELMEFIDRNGCVDEEGVLRPEFKALMQVEAALLKIEQQLGFTPIARQKLKAEKPKEEEDEFGDF